MAMTLSHNCRQKSFVSLETHDKQGHAYRNYLQNENIVNLKSDNTVDSFLKQAIHAEEALLQKYNFRIAKSEISVKQALDEHFIMMLIDLAILAQSWGMSRLHNHAINKYQSVEAIQDRERPLDSHIRIVYERSATDAPLRQLMADYTYARCRQFKTHADLLHVFTCCPDFLSDFLKRVDDRSVVKSGTPLIRDSAPNAYMLD